jgi:proteasome beta subunit
MFRKEGSNILEFSSSESSFHQLLKSEHPAFFMPPSSEGGKNTIPLSVPHGTTVLALKFRDGVIVAGDRRATEGYSIAERRIEKVHAVDDTSVIAIAGAAGPCMEMVRLLRIELEHYEKIEGTKLSMEGKASKLAWMIKGNLPMAMQGLVVMPLFAGFDAKRGCCRIYKYDIAGGQYEEADYYAIGSGGKDARGSMKKIFKKDLNQEEAVVVAVEALYDAAEADVATGGPDWVRGIFPIVKVITKEGVLTISDEVLKVKLNHLIAQQGG